MTSQHHILSRSDGATIAYDRIDGASPGIVFLHGLNSDRGGTKAQALANHCRESGRLFVAFDMYGHGDSSGTFADGTISRWTEDALAVLDHMDPGRHILVGSSMGGWVMVRVALQRADKIGALIGIAAAPDFTEDLMWASLTEKERTALEKQGYLEQPSEYDEEPYIISKKLIDDGRNCLVLRDTIEISHPACLIHSQKDEDVPWQTALRLSEALASEAVQVVLVKDGDHRLSRPEDLKRLTQTVDHYAQMIAERQ